MKRYTITIECIRTYEINADNEAEALDIAEEKFEEADRTIYIEREEEID